MSSTPQLVGSNCVLCGRPVGSVVEGAFCARCGCPVHFACVPDGDERSREGACAGCGAATSMVQAEHARQDQDNVGFRKDLQGARGARLVLGGVGLIGVGIGFSLLSTAASSGGSISIGAIGAIAGGLVLALRGFYLIVRAGA
jgi:hypothetical protein